MRSHVSFSSREDSSASEDSEDEQSQVLPAVRKVAHASPVGVSTSSARPSTFNDSNQAETETNNSSTSKVQNSSVLENSEPSIQTENLLENDDLLLDIDTVSILIYIFVVIFILRFVSNFLKYYTFFQGLEQYLKVNAIGKEILKEYQQNGDWLKKTIRSKLVRLVIRREKDWQHKDIPAEKHLEKFEYVSHSYRLILLKRLIFYTLLSTLYLNL